MELPGTEEFARWFRAQEFTAPSKKNIKNALNAELEGESASRNARFQMNIFFAGIDEYKKYCEMKLNGKQ